MIIKDKYKDKDKMWIVTEMLEMRGSSGSLTIECNVLGLFNTHEEAQLAKNQHKLPKSKGFIADYSIDMLKIEQGFQYTTIGSIFQYSKD